VATLTDERAREWLGEAVLPAVLSRFLLANALAELGRLGEALRNAQDGVDIAEAADHPWTKSLAYCGLGYVWLGKGDLTEAIRRLTQALGLARAADLPFMVPHVAGPLATACALAGRTAEAVELAEEAVALSASLKRASWHALLVARLADAHLAAGRVPRAREVVIDALEQARRRKERGDEATILTVVGKIESDADHGDPGMAQSAYREALTLANELGMRPLVARCHLGLGTLSRRTGGREQAREHLTTAAMMYREMDIRFWLERAEAEMRELA
jgi:tetratricopeptide (TPR) repeat protein